MAEIREVNIIARLVAHVESDDMTKFAKEVKETDTAVKDLEGATEDLEQTNESLSGSIKNSIANYKVFGVSINDVTGKLTKWKSALVASQRGLTGTSKALNVFKIALASTGIGLLVIALGSVVVFLTKTKAGSDLLSKSMAGLGAAFSVIIDRVAGLGQLIIKAFNDPIGAIKALGKTIFKAIIDPIGAITGIANGVKEIGVEAIQAAKKAAVFDTQMRQLIRREKELELERAKADRRIKSLNKDSEDTTLGIKRQAKAAQEAFDLEQGFLQKEIALQKERISIIEQQQALSNNLDEDDFALADEKIKLENLVTTSLEKQTTIQNKLNTLRTQGVAAQKELKDETENVIDTVVELKAELERVTDLLNSGSVDPFNLPKLLSDLSSLNKQLDEIETSVRFLNRGFDDDAFSIASLGISDSLISETAEKNTLDSVKKLQAQSNKVISDTQAKQAKEAEALRQKNINSVKGAALQTLQVAKDLSGQLLEIEISRIDKQIALAEERVSKFKELAEQGSAEQLQLEEERLDALIEKREEAAEKQKAVAAIEIAINTATAIAAGISAVISGFKLGPIAGIANAVALAATVASSILAFNSALSSIPSFATGTERFKGVGTETSDSNLAKLSINERVVDAWTNNQIGFGFPNALLPAAVKAYHMLPQMIVSNTSTINQSNYDELARKMDATTRAVKGLSLQSKITYEGIETTMKQRAYFQNRANAHARR